MKEENLPTLHRVDCDADLDRLADLAKEIWNQHYPAIIGQEQVDFMLKNFQSKSVLRREWEAGVRHTLLLVNGVPEGYASLEPGVGDQAWKLSKLYLKENLRGRGFGRILLNHVIDECLRGGADALWLTVNRHNERSIAWYETMGFEKVQEICVEIGGGFVMDDWLMSLELDAPEA